MPGSPKKPAEIRQGHPKTAASTAVTLRDEERPIPLPPRGLLKRSRQRWMEYWTSQVAKAADTTADLHRVERWIQAVDEYERVLPIFRKERVVEGSTGQPTLNPLGAYLKTLQTEISKAETELGLTPMARLRLGIVFGQARLTAAELNKALNDGMDVDGRSDVDAELAAEWAEA